MKADNSFTVRSRVIIIVKACDYDLIRVIVLISLAILRAVLGHGIKDWKNCTSQGGCGPGLQESFLRLEGGPR